MQDEDILPSGPLEVRGAGEGCPRKRLFVVPPRAAHMI